MKVPTIKFRDTETPAFVRKARAKASGAVSATKSKTTEVRDGARNWVHERTEPTESE